MGKNTMNPQEIISWTFEQSLPTIITTSFGNQSAVLLHMVSKINPTATVLWLDTQFNTDDTLLFKDYICKRLKKLNIIRYTGESWTTNVPEYNTTEYEKFVEQVKLVPFQRAFKELNPSFWITGIRREQTECRRLTETFLTLNTGLIKVSPLLDWTDNDMNEYLQTYNLPNETNYYDPTKPDEYKECGIHTMEIEKIGD